MESAKREKDKERKSRGHGSAPERCKLNSGAQSTRAELSTGLTYAANAVFGDDQLI